MRSTFALLLWGSVVHGFVVPTTTTTQNHRATITSRLYSSSNHHHLDVVVFGVGDLRVDDHGGLRAALEDKSDSKILPVVLLDSSITSHNAFNTVHMMAAAIQDLQQSLQKELGLTLHIAESVEQLASLDASSYHVCDLGTVDTQLGTGAHAALLNTNNKNNIRTWTCHLRDKPWEDIESLPSSYPDYQGKYSSSAVLQPIDKSSASVPVERQATCDTLSTTIPTGDDILKIFFPTTADLERCKAEQDVGLFATHWGGLDFDSVGESIVLETLKAYTEDCDKDDGKFAQHPSFPDPRFNRMSLEHATMKWMQEEGGHENLMAGEAMTRFMLAPLWLGTVSPRRVYHAMKKNPPFFPSPLKTLVEGQEWHKLLASSLQNKNDETYKYWRWHGFLCRYAERKLDPSNDKTLLLVHGFGASSGQWERLMDSISEEATVSDSPDSSFGTLLAPDLIGFGQNEKPPLTYTQYLWSGFVCDLTKHLKLKSFVIGGNSIGGYTSMSAAADDSASSTQLSSMGAPGLGACEGLVLFNTAGNVVSNKDMASTTVADLTANNGLAPCNPPRRPLARLFGNALLTGLRPNIQSICSKVYPIRPENADEELARNILRDSLDPGAVNIMMSGSKLPTPRTANELLLGDSSEKESTFAGPVLVAQGMLDPLNDAPARAALLGAIRPTVTVTPIQGGHCPHDEAPQECQQALQAWMAASVATGSKILA